MDPAVILIPLVIAAVIAVIVFSAMAAAKRRNELEAWAAGKGLRFDASRDSAFDERFADFSCLRQGSNRYAYSLMRGDWNGRAFLGFDYHYETYSHDKHGRKTHHHRFSAVILDSPLPLRPLFIRPEGFFDKVTEFFGYDDIDFESAEFSRCFYVKSPDKRWAYDVLHQRAMQFLLDRPRFTLQFDSAHVIAYRGSCFGAPDFQAAADTIAGLLDAMPEYLQRQLKERA